MCRGVVARLRARSRRAAAKAVRTAGGGTPSGAVALHVPVDVRDQLLVDLEAPPFEGTHVPLLHARRFEGEPHVRRRGAALAPRLPELQQLEVRRARHAEASLKTT